MLFLSLATAILLNARSEPLALSWRDNILTVTGPELPGERLEIWYLEAYCRPGSTDRDWSETVIGHATELIEAAPDGSRLKLRCKLNDGVIVDHVIIAHDDEVEFQLTARNPTKSASQAHWAQPCIRVDRFVGVPADKNSEKYLSKSFIFLEGKLAMLPTEPWAIHARYVPGQVWCPANVPRTDVNPRPLSRLVPTDGLIGCVSADGTKLLATAWEPYQELFQGVIVCLHSDFRIGGLEPGESKEIRGKIYVLPNEPEALLQRYRRDFAK
jgi:hypothetical protein